MRLPEIKNAGKNTLYTNHFGGINKANGAPIGEWEELRGFDLSYYPSLSRTEDNGNNTAADAEAGSLTGSVYHDGKLVYTVADGIYIEGVKTALPLTTGKKELVNMGAYIMIFPDMIRFLPSDKTYEISSVKAPDIVGNLSEINESDNKGHKTKKFYLRVKASAEYRFKDGQSVILKLPNNKEKAAVITSRTAVVPGGASQTNTPEFYDINFDVSLMPDTNYHYITEQPQTGLGAISIFNVTMESALKSMTFNFPIEHNNRLWACSDDGHEIYCSKLGDPLTWGEFKGLSTDCYSVTVGSEGRFTGSAVFSGKVMFFKEGCVHSIYGTKPANFTVSHYMLSGVKSGCDKSVCYAGGLLYYQGRNGIYAFNGNTSYRIDYKLGKHSACLLGAGDEDMLCMVGYGLNKYTEDNFLSTGSVCYIYDFVHEVWHTEFFDRFVSGAFSNNGIKLLLSPKAATDDYILHNITSGESNPSISLSVIPGVAVTGNLLQDIPLMKYPVKIQLLTDNYIKDTLKIELSDNNGMSWEKVYEKKAIKSGGIITVPITSPRLFSLKMRITAYGSFKLYGLYIYTEEGSELV